MAFTINSGSNPPITTFQTDMLELVAYLYAGGYLSQQLTAGSLDLLKSIANPANGTTSIVLS
jgi:hypothetical protein